ncbi:DNA-binding NarL/FixJ family response regulator [Deinococcus metalli]|uniref:DNA-binding NarL/FixJ family response regulator n=1 Tax=Deinococcus metalli TaxID=1141878 RepID=A0A7W8KAF0_9DEIO|nr:response regulator transcription factor [Deinococcus metalli]MBB5374612.1 DNA-binding NarL/FixJ family response regulator [Deinococcus metalli]GHF35020.1 DNA-binding response regulator [Deinococcus metalli]
MTTSPPSPAVRVLLVDDHAVVRQGLRLFLGLDPQIEVVGEAANGEEALAEADALIPDVIVMDLMMPVMDGITATRALRKRLPDTEIIALTSTLEEHKVNGAIEAGAISYMLKDASSDTLADAIHAAARGEVRLHPEAAKRLVRDFRGGEMRETLTPKETIVLQLIAHGYSNRDIAADQGVSEATVKTHVSRLLGKLGLDSRTQAALYALKQGIASLDGVEL